MTRCLICDTPLTVGAWFEGWCVGCASKGLAALLGLRDLKHGDVTILADIFRQVHQPFLATVIIKVPFEERPTAAELERLSE